MKKPTDMYVMREQVRLEIDELASYDKIVRPKPKPTTPPKPKRKRPFLRERLHEQLSGIKIGERDVILIQDYSASSIINVVSQHGKSYCKKFSTMLIGPNVQVTRLG
jgi:hypothetical protein